MAENGCWVTVYTPGCLTMRGGPTRAAICSCSRYSAAVPPGEKGSVVCSCSVEGFQGGLERQCVEFAKSFQVGQGKQILPGLWSAVLLVLAEDNRAALALGMRPQVRCFAGLWY